MDEQQGADLPRRPLAIMGGDRGGVVSPGDPCAGWLGHPLAHRRHAPPVLAAWVIRPLWVGWGQSAQRHGDPKNSVAEGRMSEAASTGVGGLVSRGTDQPRRHPSRTALGNNFGALNEWLKTNQARVQPDIIGLVAVLI